MDFFNYIRKNITFVSNTDHGAIEIDTFILCQNDKIKNQLATALDRSYSIQTKRLHKALLIDNSGYEKILRILEEGASAWPSMDQVDI